MLGDDGGTLIVLHGADRVGHVSWRKVKTGPTAFGWAIGVGLVPEFGGRGYGSAAQMPHGRMSPWTMANITQSFVSTVPSSRNAQYDHGARVHH